jgi:Tfp pilus assembly protein PilO
MRNLLPLVLVIAAIGLFAGYTNPAYQSTKAIAAEKSSYDAALATSKELRAQRDTLLSRRNTFAPEDVQKLTRMLPDNVDNIRLIIDINNVAARHSLSLKDVQLGAVSNGTTPQSAAAVGQNSDPTGSVDLGFTVNANYENFQAFLVDLEHSLRLIDIVKINFKTGDGTTNDYNVSIRTYWLH